MVSTIGSKTACQDKKNGEQSVSENRLVEKEDTPGKPVKDTRRHKRYLLAATQSFFKPSCSLTRFSHQREGAYFYLPTKLTNTELQPYLRRHTSSRYTIYVALKISCPIFDIYGLNFTHRQTRVVNSVLC